MSKFSEATPEVQVALLATALISVFPDAVKGLGEEEKLQYAAFVCDQIDMTDEDLRNIVDQRINPNAVKAAAIVDEQEAACRARTNQLDA